MSGEKPTTFFTTATNEPNQWFIFGRNGTFYIQPLMFFLKKSIGIDRPETKAWPTIW